LPFIAGKLMGPWVEDLAKILLPRDIRKETKVQVQRKKTIRVAKEIKTKPSYSVQKNSSKSVNKTLLIGLQA
jgi:hypothetical protein